MAIVRGDCVQNYGQENSAEPLDRFLRREAAERRASASLKANDSSQTQQVKAIKGVAPPRLNLLATRVSEAAPTKQSKNTSANADVADAAAAFEKCDGSPARNAARCAPRPTVPVLLSGSADASHSSYTDVEAGKVASKTGDVRSDQSPCPTNAPDSPGGTNTTDKNTRSFRTAASPRCIDETFFGASGPGQTPIPAAIALRGAAGYPVHPRLAPRPTMPVPVDLASKRRSSVDGSPAASTEIPVSVANHGNPASNAGNTSQEILDGCLFESALKPGRAEPASPTPIFDAVMFAADSHIPPPLAKFEAEKHFLTFPIARCAQSGISTESRDCCVLEAQFAASVPVPQNTPRTPRLAGIEAAQSGRTGSDSEGRRISEILAATAAKAAAVSQIILMPPDATRSVPRGSSYHPTATRKRRYIPLSSK